MRTITTGFKGLPFRRLGFRVLGFRILGWVGNNSEKLPKDYVAMSTPPRHAVHYISKYMRRGESCYRVSL